MPPRSVVPLLALAVAGLRGQDVVIPSSCLTLDGTGGGAFAGFTSRFRMQILLDATSLGGVVNREITSLAVRRDGQEPRAMRGGRAALLVRVATTGALPTRASPRFADNLGTAAVEVFRGVVTLPDAPALQDRNGAGWQATHTVVVPFTTAFFYGGGTLCVDIEGEAVAGQGSPWWRIDYDIWTHDGHVSTFGSACDARGHAFASANTLVPAGSVRLAASGPARSAAVAMIAASRLPVPLPLGFLGAPQCTLDVQPIVALGATHADLVSDGYGVGGFDLQLPVHRELAGSAFFVQWAAFPSATNPNSLSTSNALELRVASQPVPTAKGALVRTGPVEPGAIVPEEGRVFPHLVPVVRLGTR